MTDCTTHMYTAVSGYQHFVDLGEMHSLLNANTI
jgi:hypothetical protein